MIGQVFKFFRLLLNESLEIELAPKLFESTVDNPLEVHFPAADGGGDSISFKSEGLTLLLVNLEQDETTRNANPYITVKEDKYYNVMPEIRLNLQMLVVANWSNDYVSGLNALSKVISFFQRKKVFRLEDKYPKGVIFPEEVEKLNVDLITLPFNQQNEVWNALRTHYRPSALFKVRMVIFRQKIENDKPVPKIEKGGTSHDIGSFNDYIFYFIPEEDEIKIHSEARLNDLKSKIERGLFKNMKLNLTVNDFIKEWKKTARKKTIKNYFEKELKIELNKITFQRKKGKPQGNKILIFLEWIAKDPK